MNSTRARENSAHHRPARSASACCVDLSLNKECERGTPLARRREVEQELDETEEVRSTVRGDNIKADPDLFKVKEEDDAADVLGIDTEAVTKYWREDGVVVGTRRTRSVWLDPSRCKQTRYFIYKHTCSTNAGSCCIFLPTWKTRNALFTSTTYKRKKRELKRIRCFCILFFHCSDRM